MALLDTLSKIFSTKTSPANVPATEDEKVTSSDMNFSYTAINKLRNFQKFGSSVASASTISINSSVNYITGTTTINNIDVSNLEAGYSITLIFDDAVKITHAAGGDGEIFLQKGADYTTSANEILNFRIDNSNKIRECGTTKSQDDPLSNFWFPIVYSSRTDDNTFVSNGVDYSKYEGYGVRIVDSFDDTYYYIIDSVTFSTNSTIEVFGEGALPVNIVSVEICRPIYLREEKRVAQGEYFDNTNSDLFDDRAETTNKTEINTPVRIPSRCKLLGVKIDIQGAATTTDWVLNFRVNSGTDDLLSSDLTIDASKTTGVLIDIDYNQLDKDDYLRTVVKTAGDGSKDAIFTYLFLLLD